jgi:transcriptional regulator of acetoin/glycerol metabolism
MSFTLTPLSALVTDAPDAAKVRILKALRAAHGDPKVAAEALGCSWRTLYRWIAQLGMHGELEDIRSKWCPTCGQARH